MPNYTGTVDSFSMFDMHPNNGHVNTKTYTITVTPDGGGSAITFSGKDVGKSYTKGQKITYSGTKGPKGDMLYSLYI